MNYIYDIETGALPEAELLTVMPEFEAPTNYKDPSKVEAAIAEKRAAWMERAALSAVTGRILAIGVKPVGGDVDVISGDEAVMLRTFWALAKEAKAERRLLIGFNTTGFDLPFMVRRSWKLGVRIPLSLLNVDNRPNKGVFVDILEAWQCGDRQERVSLNTLAKYLGVGAKNGSGADFAKLWQTERSIAEAYLRNDLALTEAVADRLGLLEEIKPAY
jgi:DNA polymerase elongation subunit (family B)